MSTRPTARIETYLDDLARMLAGAEPALRAEVLGGVREHVDTALGNRAGALTDAEVDVVLAELGPPEEVAAAAMENEAGMAPSGVPRPQATGPAAPTRLPALERGWVPPTVGLLLLATMGVYLLALAGVSFFFVATEVTPEVAGGARSGGGFHAPAVEDFAAAQTPMLPAAYDVLWSAVAPVFLVGVPWLVAVVLLAASSLWAPRQKWAGALLLPGGVVLNAALLAVMTSTSSAGAGPAVVLMAAWVVTAAVTVVVVAALWRAGSRRARQVVSGASPPPVPVYQGP